MAVPSRVTYRSTAATMTDGAGGYNLKDEWMFWPENNKEMNDVKIEGNTERQKEEIRWSGSSQAGLQSQNVLML